VQFKQSRKKERKRSSCSHHEDKNKRPFIPNNVHFGLLENANKLNVDTLLNQRVRFRRTQSKNQNVSKGCGKNKVQTVPPYGSG